MRPRQTSSLLVLLVLVILVGCDEEKGRNEQRAIHRQDMPQVLEIVREDLDRAAAGVRQAADMLSRGFVVEDPQQRERELRMVLRRLRDPQRPQTAIPGLMTTPVSFVAAVGADGKVIARDAEDDQMRGFDIAEAAPVVRRALDEGARGHALSRLPSLEEGDRASVTTIFAAPARHEERVVGAVVAGLPLWRLGQQMSRQLQLENADAIQRGELIWVLLYEGDELHHHGGFPPDLRELVPSHADRQAGLERSAGGFTGEVNQYGRWYGYGVLPLPSLGEGVGAVIFRSDPV